MGDVTVRDWPFEHPERRDYYLLTINPDGSTDMDGGHSTPAGVAKARHLIEQLACITKQPGLRYVMVRVEPVPEFKGRVNEGAIATLNRSDRWPAV